MTEQQFNDEYFMKKALLEAQAAYQCDEVPIGAVVVVDNNIIAKAYNLTETLNDVTAHAEMQAITSAANTIGSKYLTGCTLYVTLEPCIMCAGAIFWSQIDRLVFGAFDPKRGYTRNTMDILHPRTVVISGVIACESQALLQRFFRSKRPPQK